MKTNYPYRATAMKAVDPKGVCCHSKGEEYCSHPVMETTKPMHKPSKIGASGSMIDGPYGGKKPQS